MKNLNEMGVLELNSKSLKKIDGGSPWYELFRSFVTGELINAAKNAYVNALDGYINACGNGTYYGIPGCRR